MSLFEIGRIVVKTSGRDSGRVGLVIDILDKNNVMVDGNLRRKKCNVKHLEPMKEVVKVKKNETHENVIKILKDNKIKISEKKIRSKSKGVKIRPKKIKSKKIHEKKEVKTTKKTEVKEKPKEKKDDKGKK